MENPNPKVTNDSVSKQSAKRLKVELDEERPIYYYWIADQHSFTMAEIQPYVKVQPNPHGLIVTPNRGIEQAFYVEYCMDNLPKHEGDCRKHFIRDVSKTNGDTICSLSRKSWKSINPFLLNFNGRSYSLKHLLQLVKSLKSGTAVRLEDLTIHPEQLCNLVLYPNQTLGAKRGQRSISYKNATCPINKFNPSRALEFKPEFWADASKEDKLRGMWAMEEAAVKHKFVGDNDSHIVIADQHCVKAKVAWPHPKSLHHGSTFFKNCLFVDCEIHCWCFCGCFFHGCRFVNCIFVWHLYESGTTGHASKCEIYGAMVFDGYKNKNPGQDVLAEVKKLFGEEAFESVELIAWPTERQDSLRHGRMFEKFNTDSQLLGAVWEHPEQFD